jgi:hypothetical protein
MATKNLPQINPTTLMDKATRYDPCGELELYKLTLQAGIEILTEKAASGDKEALKRLPKISHSLAVAARRELRRLAA